MRIICLVYYPKYSVLKNSNQLVFNILVDCSTSLVFSKRTFLKQIIKIARDRLLDLPVSHANLENTLKNGASTSARICLHAEKVIHISYRPV